MRVDVSLDWDGGWAHAGEWKDWRGNGALTLPSLHQAGLGRGNSPGFALHNPVLSSYSYREAQGRTHASQR